MARTLAAALLIGGWVVLGALGQRYTPLWAGGLLPLAVWLATTGSVVHVAAARPLPSLGWSRIALGAAAATGSALIGLQRGGGGAASLCAAAACWGVALGAMLALAGGGTPARGGGVATLLDCALPVAWPAGWRAPSAWGLIAARWSMLPMMATLTVMATWCGASGGPTTGDWVALHVLAMLLPAGMMVALRVRLEDGAWAASALLASGAALLCATGSRELMLASCAQALAWGLAGATRQPQSVAGAPAQADERGGVWVACCPAVVVLGLGVALDRTGPAAIGVVQATLALLGAASLVARARSSLLAAPAGLAPKSSRTLLWHHRRGCGATWRAAETGGVTMSARSR